MPRARLAETLPEDEAAAADGERRRVGVAVLQAGLSVLADAVGEEVKRASEGETAPSQALDVRVERERLMRFTVWPVIGDVCEV